jgi:uncharacterized protein (DUF2126 family)
VIIEGDRLHPTRACKLAVTPDPGVIEVNLHPSASWDGGAQDRPLRRSAPDPVGAEKFMLDGRHAGTGGGIVF